MTEKLERLLAELSEEGAGEAEIESLMEKVMAEPGGLEAIRDLAKQVVSPGAAVDLPTGEDSSLTGRLRLMVRIEVIGSQPLVWRRFSLPADCSFFHLHRAIQDAFDWDDPSRHHFEIREEGRVVVLIGPEDQGDRDDELDCYDESGCRVDDLLREEVGEFFYRVDGQPTGFCRVVLEELVGAGRAGTSGGLLPRLHGGAGRISSKEGETKGFDPTEVVFRDPARRG